MSYNEQPGRCIIFSAPSGAGKTTLVRHILNMRSDLAFSVSATSRAPRGDEREGFDYYYMSPDEFRAQIAAEAFVEWEEVYHDQYYGTLKAEIVRIWGNQKHVVFDVDVEGGVNLKAAFGDRALSVFVQPPSLAVLENRLRSRGTESDENIAKRMAKAERELTYVNRFDHILVNDDLERAKLEVVDLVERYLTKN
jgi:guanylate kinase